MPSQGGRVVRGNGGFSPLRLPFALIFGVISSIAVGVALFFSGKLVYLIFASAFFAALIAGFFAQLTIKFGKIRNSLFGLLFGLIMGAIAYGAYWGAEYVGTIIDVGNEARSEIRKELTQNGASASDKDVEEAMNSILQEITGSTGFIGLMKLTDMDLQEQTGNTGIIGFITYQAQTGFSISRVGSNIGDSSPSPSAPAIKDGLAWGYYGIELLMFIIAGALIASGAASDPFCVEQNRWLKLQPLAQVLEPAINPFMQAFQNGDLYTASQYIQPNDPKSPLPKLRIDVGRCDKQSTQGLLRIALIPQGAQARRKENAEQEQILFDGEINHLDLLLNRQL
ncbi:MAG: hypothetical protein CUN52_10985 [Phototrophicales bacterium]|nr:MAG: hypothetical protein CUN52_10985 [Phototrophicales bacterium]